MLSRPIGVLCQRVRDVGDVPACLEVISSLRGWVLHWPMTSEGLFCKCPRRLKVICPLVADENVLGGRGGGDN